MYKNQLQELAQRSCFSLPSYTCIREGPDHAPRFKAVVSFNGEVFESPHYYSTLRQAEHAAAEVALHSLYCREPFRALVARIMDETSVCKNLLQEAAQRAGLSLPDYTTVRSGPGHMPVFKCIVEVAGMVFVGDPAKTKKQAEKNAAMAAWSALKLVNYQQRTPSLLLNGPDDSSLDPCMALAVIDDRVSNSSSLSYSSNTRTRSPFLSSLSSSGYDRALPPPPPTPPQQRESSSSGRFYPPPSLPNMFQAGSSSSVGAGPGGAIATASPHTRGLLNNPPKLPSVYSNKRYERDLAVAMAMAMEEHQKDEDEWLQRGAGGGGSGGEIRVEREQSFRPSYTQKRYEHDLAVAMAMAMEEHQKDEEEREQQKQKQQQACIEKKREERERKSGGSSSLWPSRLQWWRGSSSSSSSSSSPASSMQRKATEIRESRESVMAYQSATNLAPPVRVRPMVAVCSAPPPRRHPEPHAPPNPHHHFNLPQVNPRSGVDPNSNPEETTRELLNRLRL